MLYREIVKSLAKQRKITLEELALKLGLRGQSTLSTRLKDSWNPGMSDANDLLRELGYEVVFAPIGTVENSKALSQSCFVPEFPDKPAK